jgi:hypothetical protein
MVYLGAVVSGRMNVSQGEKITVRQAGVLSENDRGEVTLARPSHEQRHAPPSTPYVPSSFQGNACIF